MKVKITYFHLVVIFLPTVLVWLFGSNWGMDVAQFPWMFLALVSVVLSKEVPDAWKKPLTGSAKLDLLIYFGVFIVLTLINLKLASH